MRKEEKRSARTSRRSKIAVIVILLAAAGGFAALCMTKTVKVEGNIHVTDAEVRTMVREMPLYENSVLLCLIQKVRPAAGSGFVEKIDLSLLGPDEVLARVTEKEFAGCTPVNGKYWYFDGRGVILAASDVPEEEREEEARIPVVEGFEKASAGVGEALPFADTELFFRLTALFRALRESAGVPDRTVVGEDGAVTVYYGDVRAALGDLSCLDEKITRLDAVLPDTKGLKGVLHLENYDGSTDSVIFEKD